MKALLRRVLRFVLSVITLAFICCYIGIIYYMYSYGKGFWYINRWMLSIAVPCVLFIWWIFMQSDKDYHQLMQSNFFKRFVNCKRIFLASSLALLLAWMATYFLIFTQTKLFGLTWVSDNILMMLSDYGWVFCWLTILALSDKSTPFYATTGFLFSGMVEFLCLFLENTYVMFMNEKDILSLHKNHIIGQMIIEDGRSIKNLIAILFLHNLVPVYIGAGLWLVSAILLKKFFALQAKAAYRVEAHNEATQVTN